MHNLAKYLAIFRGITYDRPMDFHFAECSTAVSYVSLPTTKGVWSREASTDVRRKEENPESEDSARERSIRPLFGEDAIKRDEQA